jgi:hypothetical protein
MGRNSIKNAPKAKLSLKKAFIFAAVIGLSLTGVWFVLFGIGGTLMIPVTSMASSQTPPSGAMNKSSLGTAPKGPGGVGTTDGTSSLKIWYDTDYGISLSGTSVTGWENAAGISDLDLVETGGNKPSVVFGAVNGHDEISFTSGSHWLRTAAGMLDTSNFVTDQASTFVVNRADLTNQNSTLYCTDPLVGNSRFSNHVPWNGTVYYDIGTCCNQNARLQVGGLSGLTDYNVWSYDALPATGKQVYQNGTLLQSRPNTSLYHSHATQRFRIGRNYKGDVTEVIIFKNKINSAQRIIVENYLSAKFNVTLSDNNIYTHDNPANGDFDHDVAGIGRVDASNIHNDAQGTGIIRMMNPSGLDDNEFFFWGHDDGGLHISNSSSLPNGVNSKLNHVWAVSEADATGSAVDVGAIDVVFDLADISGTHNASELRLLIDTDMDGSFADETPIAGAASVSGGTDLFIFAGVTDLANNVKFTLGFTSSVTVSTNFGTAPKGPGGVGTTDGSSNLVLWLDASNVTGSNGATINNWEDASGNGNNFTGGNGATFQTAGTNGYPVFEFNGTSDYFEMPYSASLNTSEFTVMTAANVTGSSGYKALVSNRDDPAGSATAGYILYAHPNSNQWRFWTGRSGGGWQQTNGVVSTAGSWASMSMSYAATANGKKIYVNNILKNSSTHTMTLNPSRPYRVGAGRNEGSPAYYFQGTIGEVIQYDEVLNDAARIIVDNYLAAKYGFTLSLNDMYTFDDAANGNYDHDVAGIGRVNASNIHNDAQGTGITRVLNPTDLDNNEFMFWGHDNGAIAANNITDVPNGVDSRLERVWAVSEVGPSSNSVDVGAIDIVFDLASIAGSFSTSELRLLVDTDADGSFTDEAPIAGAIDVNGSGQYLFAGVTAISNNVKFSIGFAPTSALPIELLSFEAEIVDEEYVQIEWITASEINNDYFTLEKSIDGVEYVEIDEIPGAGNSSTAITYEAEDYELIPGVTYYRLTQTDFNGDFKVFPPKPVEYQKEANQLTIESVGPNPFNDQFTINYSVTMSIPVEMIITNVNGVEVHREYLSPDEGINKHVFLEGSSFIPGIYLLTLIDENGDTASEKLIKQ